MTRMPTLVLASASPRRLRLLKTIGFEPTVDPADVDETIDPGSDPARSAVELAVRKAMSTSARYPSDDTVVLGADTVVTIDGELLGKPADTTDAVAMLTRLGGRTHQVHTGVAVVTGGCRFDGVATTLVTMRTLNPDEIEAYVGTGEPFDAAGAYAIQGRAAVFVERIDGDHSNVVGLPLALTAGLLARAGLDVADRWRQGSQLS
jgi:septum formation protein